MSYMHTDGMTCGYCAPFVHGAKRTPLITTPSLFYTPPNTPLAPPQIKSVSSDCLEGALNERRRIVEALKNVGYGELAGKIDRGEL